MNTISPPELKTPFVFNATKPKRIVQKQKWNYVIDKICYSIRNAVYCMYKLITKERKNYE